MLREKFTENLNYSQFFSFEVLDYFDSICTDKNYEWIVKYFDVLMKEENKTAEKFNMHHIRPCCTFKDEEIRTRKQTLFLANKFNRNLIKLSIYNHLFAHFYLWKIFDNRDLKLSFQRMCGQEQYINNLTENELKNIAKLKENCSMKNRTNEEKIRYMKNWRNKNKNKIKEYYEKTKDRKKQYKKLYDEKHKEERKEYRLKNKEKISQQMKNYYEKNKETIDEYQVNYRQEHKDELKNYDKIRRETHKEELKKKRKQYNSQKCIDPIKNDTCSLCALRERIKKHKNIYGNRNASDYIIK